MKKRDSELARGRLTWLSVALLVCTLPQARCLAQADGTASQDFQSIKIFSLQHAPADQAYRILQTILAGKEGVRMELDQHANAIILMAEEADHEIAQELLLRLDERRVADPPAENLSLRITWLVDGRSLSPEQREELDTSPDSLSEVVKALTEREQILADVQVMRVSTSVSPTLASAQPTGREFSNDSLRVGREAQFGLKAHGEISADTNDLFKLNLKLDLIVTTVTASMHTTITLPKNHPVVLSVSSVGSLKSVAIVELVDPE